MTGHKFSEWMVRLIDPFEDEFYLDLPIRKGIS